jgi:REP element-mobilizing transposase RayT
MYHLVFPAKYRKVIFSEEVDSYLKEVCLEISKRYEVRFLEIGTDKDHVHFLVQSVPAYSVYKIVRLVKSITARMIFEKFPEIRKQLWGGEFWSDGYFVSSVSKHGNEDVVGNYIKKQGQEESYKKLHEQDEELWLF